MSWSCSRRPLASLCSIRMVRASEVPARPKSQDVLQFAESMSFSAELSSVKRTTC